MGRKWSEGIKEEGRRKEKWEGKGEGGREEEEGGGKVGVEPYFHGS